MNNIDEFYDVTDKIVDLYDKLVLLLLIDSKKDSDYKEIKLLIKDIKNMINIEDSLYNNLNIDDINNFIGILHNKDNNELKFRDVRINNRLVVLYDKLLGNIVLNNDLINDIDENFNFSFIDLISSKFTIDIYKLIDSKIDGIRVIDDKSIDYIDKIKKLNIQYMVYKLSICEFSELMGLEKGYDIKNISVISDSVLDDMLSGSFKETINSKVFRFLLKKINEFKNLPIDLDNYECIYDNLLYMSMFEILIRYLNEKQLEFIFAYFSRISSGNKMVSNNIKRLVRRQINMF